jgi:hypothetical protein
MDAPAGLEFAVCPFLEDSDCRCAARLSLDRLDEALGYCADEFVLCPTYREKQICDGCKQEGKPARLAVAIAV